MDGPLESKRQFYHYTLSIIKPPMVKLFHLNGDRIIGPAHDTSENFPGIQNFIVGSVGATREIKRGLELLLY
jgi:hypothetical protein